MSKNRPMRSWSAALPASAFVAVLSCALVRAADAPPPPPASPPATRLPPKPDLDAQLEAAQRKLEQAAHEVAQLSTRLSGTLIDQVMPLVGPGHAIIGAQLEPAGEAAGARVREVSPGGPAAEAGVRVGDVIVALNGTELKGDEPARQVVGILQEVKPDSRVSVRVLRDGKPREFTVTVRGGPDFFAAAVGMPDFDFDFPQLQGASPHRPLRDMALATLTPRLGSYFGSDKGVLVVRSPTDGALKLEDGDVILAIDGRQPTSGSHATRILSSYQPGERVTLHIIRQHKTLDLEATLPERARRDTTRRDGIAPVTPKGAVHRVLVVGSDQA